MVENCLANVITTDAAVGGDAKRGLCKFHALHYKLYLHTLNMDAMIASRQFDEPVKLQSTMKLP